MEEDGEEQRIHTISDIGQKFGIVVQEVLYIGRVTENVGGLAEEIK